MPCLSLESAEMHAATQDSCRATAEMPPIKRCSALLCSVASASGLLAPRQGGRYVIASSRALHENMGARHRNVVAVPLLPEISCLAAVGIGIVLAAGGGTVMRAGHVRAARGSSNVVWVLQH